MKAKYFLSGIGSGTIIGIILLGLLAFAAFELRPPVKASIPAITFDDITNPKVFVPGNNPLADVKKSERIQHDQKSFHLQMLDVDGKLTDTVDWVSPDSLRTTSAIKEGYEHVQIGLTYYQKVPGQQWTETTERSMPECPGIDFVVDSAISARYFGKVTRDGWEMYWYEVDEPRNQGQSDRPELADIWISAVDGLPRRVELHFGSRTRTLIYGNYNDKLPVMRPYVMRSR